MQGEAILVALVFIGFFLLVFGIIYLQKRENLAMLEKGINPRASYSRPAPFKNLKWALLLVGAGTGLLLAYFLDTYAFSKIEAYVQDGIIHHYRSHDDNPAIYFSLIAIGGGLGLFW